MSGLPSVVQCLIGCYLRLEVVQEIGSIQRANLEVLVAELVLSQQGRKHKDRVIAAGPGLRVINLGQVTTPGFRDTAFGGLAGGVRSLNRLIPVERHVYCVF